MTSLWAATLAPPAGSETWQRSARSCGKTEFLPQEDPPQKSREACQAQKVPVGARKARGLGA